MAFPIISGKDSWYFLFGLGYSLLAFYFFYEQPTDRLFLRAWHGREESLFLPSLFLIQLGIKI
jgi:hypothetical protein